MNFEGSPLLNAFFVFVFLFLSFCYRFTREKKSNVMAVDLNTDLFVIFASGPVGNFVCLFQWCDYTIIFLCSLTSFLAPQNVAYCWVVVKT